MTYLIAVFEDRLRAEAAYSGLERGGIPMEWVSILGRGYQSADEFGLIDPEIPARRQMTLMAFWLVPFGFVAGVAFSILSGLETFAWAGLWGNHIIGGFLGAGAAAMGSFTVGGGIGLLLGGGDALTYRNRLEAGKYLVVVQGSTATTQLSTRILRQFSPEQLQGYSEPETT